jgi:hypothetical protein
MIFEVGKFYRHNTGHEISIVGRLKTTMFGETLVAESNGSIELSAVGSTESYAENYKEISEEEWMKNFNKGKRVEDCKHTITQNDLCTKCGEWVFATETKPCGECNRFKRKCDGWSYCMLKLMTVTKDMRVYYKIKEGSCFEEKVNNEKEGKEWKERY